MRRRRPPVRRTISPCDIQLRHDFRLEGYKPTAAKTVDEYATLDAGDESLARWKASLGIVPGSAGGSASGPKVRTLLDQSLCDAHLGAR